MTAPADFFEREPEFEPRDFAFVVALDVRLFVRDFPPDVPPFVAMRWAVAGVVWPTVCITLGFLDFLSDISLNLYVDFQLLASDAALRLSNLRDQELDLEYQSTSSTTLRMVSLLVPDASGRVRRIVSTRSKILLDPSPRNRLWMREIGIAGPMSVG
jgi:hypothetical protein